MATILVIHNDPDFTELARRILEARNHSVPCALNAWDGVRMAKAREPDLILLDLMMPEMGGWDVYQQMKADEEMRSIPVIVVTRLPSEEELLDAIDGALGSGQE